MGTDNSSGPGVPSPIVLRIKLRYDELDVMVQRFATNVGKSGLFLPTKSLQPVGAEVKFELRLADDTPALVGLGRVKSATAPDPDNPKATFGMAIELMRVTPQSRALILRMLERRREIGLPELGLPTAADIDEARAAAGARDAVAPDPAVAPVAAAVAPIDAAPGESLLTAPRRTSGPITVANVMAAMPLAPELPRRKRLAVSEVIESASGPVAGVAIAVPGLDDDVDVAAAILRARALAGAGLDTDLQALAEVAAPLEISIEAASAELARQLGGSAVRRDRSAQWGPPPATTPTATPASGSVEAAPAAEPEPKPEPALDAAPEPALDAAPEPAAAEPNADSKMEPTLEVASVMPEAEPIDAAPLQLTPLLERADDDQPDEDEDELDIDDVEHTEMGDAPLGTIVFDPLADDQAMLAARLEAQLAEAEAEADADDLGLAGDDAEPHDLSLEEIEDFEILAEADADDEDLLEAHGEQDASNGGPAGAHAAGMRLPSEIDFAARLDFGEDSDQYFAVSANEFATHHVLDGEPPGDGLDDELELPEPPLDGADHALAGFEIGDDALGDPDDADEPDEPDDDRFEPARVQPIFEPESSNSFTLSGAPAEPPALESPPPLPALEPTAREPAILRAPAKAQRAPSRPSLYDSPVEDYELEHALEALDVDLDDLAIPHAAHAATQLQRDVPPRPRPAQSHTPAAASRVVRRTGGPTPASGRVVARPPTDDGVVIEFEEED